jgi:hypothetical protein
MGKVVLGYDAASRGTGLLMFRKIIVPSPSRIKTSEENSTIPFEAEEKV